MLLRGANGINSSLLFLRHASWCPLGLQLFCTFLPITTRLHSFPSSCNLRLLQQTSSVREICPQKHTHDYTYPTSSHHVQPKGLLTNTTFEDISTHSPQTLPPAAPEAVFQPNVDTSFLLGPCAPSNRPHSRSRLRRFEAYKRLKKRASQCYKIDGFDWEGALTLLQESHPIQDAADLGDGNSEMVDAERTTSIDDGPTIKIIKLKQDRVKKSVESDAAPRKLHMPADQIPLPDIWTSSTFENYVLHLTNLEFDRAVRRKFYTRSTNTYEDIAGILERLFRNVTRKELITPRACHATLSFFSRHGLLTKSLALLHRLDILEVEVQPTTLETLLHKPAHDKKIHEFASSLESLLKLGYKPGPRVWIDLLAAVEAPDARETITRQMRHRNLLNQSSTLKAVVGQVVRDDIAKFFRQGFHTSHLPAFMDARYERYGKGWLSTFAANNMLDEVGRRRGAREALELLYALKRRQLGADHVTLSTLLHLCRIERDHRLAIKIWRLFEDEFGLEPDKNAFDALFKITWNKKLFGCSKVLWRAACITDKTSRDMRRLVSKSLYVFLSIGITHAAQNVQKTRGQMWNESAGVVVTGIRPDNRVDRILSAETAIDLSSPLRCTTSPTVRDRIIEEDLTTAGQYELVPRLSELLCKAIIWDLKWKVKGTWKEESIQWRRNNALAVEMIPKLAS